MIRRTLKSGLLATVVVLALLPTAAGAAPASTTTPLPAPTATAGHHTHRAAHPGRHKATPRHHCKHTTHRKHATRRVHHRRHLALPATGRVATHRAALNVRSGPGTGYRVIGHRHAHRLLALSCKTYGSSVFGNRTWYRLRHHKGYVSAYYVRTNRILRCC
ncbi:SH3 domain-containing protein [Streptomyces sp. NPDC002671]